MPTIAIAAFSFVFAASAETSAELRQHMHKALEGVTRENQQRSQWLYTIRGDRTEYDSNGKLRSRELWHWKRIEIDGFVFHYTLERNGKPLTPAERREEDQQIQKQLAEWKRNPPPPETQSQTKPEDAWIREFPEALDYRKAGEEIIDGRKTLVLDATPRPGYKASNLRARVFEKTNAKVWIDQADGELLRVDAETYDTINVAFGIIGRIEKGTRFHLRRRPVAPGVWLTDEQTVRFGARFLLVKGLHREIRNFYSDFTRRPSPLALGQPQR